jgi:sugar transferase (PEP-CTERM/EpsH1 system associated)
MTALPHRPIRVMHLLPEFTLGGMEHGVVMLLNGLPRKRIIGSVCSFEVAIDSLRERLDRHVQVHMLGRRQGNDPMLVWRLIRLFRHERPDIVHSHSWGTLCEGYLATRLGGVVRHFIHGEHGTLELRRRNRSIQRWIWSRAQRVLSVSSTLADEMAREIGFPRNRVQVVRNGVDIARFAAISRAAAREELGVAEAEFVIGTVGRLVPVKDHETLLAALARLSRAGIDFIALVAGEGPLRPELERRAATLGLGRKVRFLGNREDIDRVLAALDVFALSSLSEGIPNTVIEAMASGLPVVATHVGGLDEVVENGKTGILVPPKAADTLADACLVLLHDSDLRRRMGVEALKSARGQFSLQRMLDDYEHLYFDLAGRSGGRLAAATEEH